MASANLRRALMGSLLALGVIGAYLAIVPRPTDGSVAAVAAYGVGLAAVTLLGMSGLVRLTFAVQHPQMPRLSGLPAEQDAEPSPFIATVRQVLSELPEALRTPIDEGRVTVRLLSGGRAKEPYASFARIGRARVPRLIICRSALERDFPDDPDALYGHLTTTVRSVLANRLHIEEFGVFEVSP